jgi:hypothetical protein
MRPEISNHAKDDGGVEKTCAIRIAVRVFSLIGRYPGQELFQTDIHPTPGPNMALKGSCNYQVGIKNGMPVRAWRSDFPRKL